MHNCERFGQLQYVRAARPIKSSHRPDGRLSHFALRLQGGGVIVNGGTVTITSSSIYGNTADYVRAQVQKLPSPPWETHVWLTVCRAAVSLSVPAAQSRSSTPKCIPIKLTMCVIMFKSSHRPHGKIADALALILACATATDASVNYRGCVLQRP